MNNDSTYWLVFSLLITGSVGFILGRFFERADRWLKDWDAQRRAVRTARAERDALLAPPKPPRVPIRQRVTSMGREITKVAFLADPEQHAWR